MISNAEAIETLRANYPAACYEQLREAVDKAITAIHENQVLKNRCFVLSRGVMCICCGMECDALGKPKGEGEK